MATPLHWGAGAGVGLTWTAAFNAADLNSLLLNNVAVSSVAAITNGTALDIYADLSFSITSQSGTGSPLLAAYLFALNGDGTTYGDGTANGSVLPGGTYQVGSVLVQPSKAAGTVHVGMLRGIVLPPGSFKFAVVNTFGFTWASSGNSIWYRTYVESSG